MKAELVVDARAQLGESPVWDRYSRRLVWVDIESGAVHFSDPDSGRDERIDIGRLVSAVVIRSTGGVVLAMRDQVAELDESRGDVGERIAVLPNASPDIRFNDGQCDPRGRLWIGTMSIHKTPDAGALFRLNADRCFERMLGPVTISNGMGWSLDGDIMYYIDTPTLGIDALDFDLDAGTIRNRRRLIDIAPDGGRPDGMTIDSTGCLWVAMFGAGRVNRYTTDGRLDQYVEVPTPFVTSCTFGGDDLSQLFITTAGGGSPSTNRFAGGVFRCEPGVSGQLSYTFDELAD